MSKKVRFLQSDLELKILGVEAALRGTVYGDEHLVAAEPWAADIDAAAAAIGRPLAEAGRFAHDLELDR